MNVTQNPLDVKLTPSSILKVVLTFFLLLVLWAVTTRFLAPLAARYIPGASAVVPASGAMDHENGHRIRTV